jgi:hypothetical protein
LPIASYGSAPASSTWWHVTRTYTLAEGERMHMHWLLFSRTAEGSWRPVFGPLSGFAGGGLMYAAVLLAPGLLIWHSVRHLRAGDEGYRSVIWWTVMTWPLFLLWGIPHAYAKGTPGCRFASVALFTLSFVWLVYFACRVVPVLLQRSKRGPCVHRSGVVL